MFHRVVVNIIVTKQLSNIGFILLVFMETSNSTTKNCYSLTDKFRFTVDFSWGVGSLRQCAGFPASFLDPEENTSYLTPLGSLIVCWDIVNGRRKFAFQAHSDLITVMLYNSRSNAVLTVCYSGEIKIWNSTWKVLLDKKARIGGIHFADWLSNGCRFLLCGGNESELIVYDMRNNKKGWSIHEKWSVCPPVANQKIHVEEDTCAHSSKGNGNPSSSTYVQQKDYYDMAVFTSDNKVVALLQRHHGKLSEAHLYAEDGDFLQQQALDPLGDTKASLMCLSQCHNGTFAVGFQGGIFLLLNEHNLSIMAVLQATGSPQVALWHGDYLLAVSYLSGIFSWWTSRGEMVHELSGGPTNSIVHLNWAVPGKSLWVGGIMSLHFVSLHYSDSSEKFPSRLEEFYSLKFLEVTGCGVAMNDTNLVVAGDFTGNVLVLEKGQTKPLYRTKYESAVRSLTWNSGLVFIGCLDGNLLRWFPQNGSNPSITLACVGGILTMDWSHNHSCLALGLDTGHLCVYKFKGQNLDEPLTEMLNIKAHFIKCDDQEEAAEIWSVCWSPCEDMIATASEDQTTSVWQLYNGKKLDTLVGHTTAVTSVDWKKMSSGQVILATCADDRTVRIHDGVTFKLRQVLNTEDIDGWYTLTYLSLNPVRQWCLCSTQNGRLVLWDCITGERLGCRKMHAGSIEGLVWNKDFTSCATVSSDCVVNMFSVNNVKKSDL